jgi:putative heme-binding domain-containing protein
LAAVLLWGGLSLAAGPDRPRKVVLIAGPLDRSHPPGTHEYEKSVRLLAHCLDHSPNLRGVRTEVHLGGWPDDPRTLDEADTVVLVASGSDRREEDHPLLVGDRLAVLERQMKRGCGLVLIHWATFAPKDKLGGKLLEWVGGYFDYETGQPPRGWYSKIQTATTKARPGSPRHPLCAGLTPFELREEYYYRIRFRDGDPRRVPVLVTPIPGERDEQVVAWAVERDGGGRGFGFTGGHFFDNWKVENFRRMVLNAVVWTAKAEVPEGGVRSLVPTEEELAGVAVGRPVRAVIVTGHQYPGHVWRETTRALQDALAPDGRMRVSVVQDVQFLAKPDLHHSDVVVFNYCNWERPGLSEAAKKNFVKYLQDGGGLVIVHFANGAFHFSLPKAAESDWPEWRTRICRRAWDHTPGKSGHDAYGKFLVQISNIDHPITRGLKAFETTDELYFRQQGDEPVVVLATARSRVTGRDEPMAFLHDYGRGRVFQTVLGHDAAALRTPGTAELIRRGTAWAAGRTPGAVAIPPAGALAPGRFGHALDARRQHAEAAFQDAYQQPPLTAECWAKLDSAHGYNLLVANNVKESATHWEMFTMPGSGHLTAYLPGSRPDHVRTKENICDGKWHHLVMVYEATHVRLHVDGKQAADERVAAAGGEAKEGALWFGAYPSQGLGCDGVIDEVRLRRGARPAEAVPDRAPDADQDTVGLWHFDAADQGRSPDASKTNNPAVICGGPNPPKPPDGPSSRTELDYRPSDPRLHATLLDRSPGESYVSLKVDTQGRLFVGGREALFVFEPDGRGGYGPRRELYRFPPDSWLAGIEVRGDDLYVATAAALYVLPGGRTKREDLKPRRLVWGIPLDLHVSFHCLAWGPEGDLYLNHGDPLLNYGDFRSPDHWGHWTLYTQPEGSKVPYTGSGAVLRLRPDGSGLRVVARGLRGPVGLTFGRGWDLFTNDNDHESMPHLYTPGRLLHVSPHADFAWPRGWVASRSPERADLLETMREAPGRGVPVGMACYDDTHLPPEYRNNLLEARWDLLTIQRHPIEPRGASHAAGDLPFLVGRQQARPVGVAVGRGGRVFAAISYMAGNEASPHYASDLVLIARADDPPDHPFDAYDATTASTEKLWAELSDPSWSRRREAHAEILRRGGDLLSEAVRRLAAAKENDPALLHLPWLAAASGTSGASKALQALARHPRPEVRLQAVRAAAAFPGLKVPRAVFEAALADVPPVQLAGLAAFLDSGDEMPDAVVKLASSSDSYLRQAATTLLARRATIALLEEMTRSPNPAVRRGAVLAAGIRLTVPPADFVPPRELPLGYPAENAFFKVRVRYADADVDLGTLGRGGSFTTAEFWKAIRPSPEQEALFALLLRMLKDPADPVRGQAAYYLSLLRDPRSDPAAAEVMQAVRLGAVAGLPPRAVEKVWVAGPFADGPEGFGRAHPPEQGAVDLEAVYRTPAGERGWREVGGAGGTLDLGRAGESSSSYVFFRLHSVSRQPVELVIGGQKGLKVWHNGRPVGAAGGTVLLGVQPGSNDLLLRVGHAGDGRLSLRFRARGEVVAALPEKLGFALLARRLREGGGKGGQEVAAEFLEVDWQTEARKGDAAQGRKLFGALGCVKCHAITADQAGGGAPSLAEAGKRFTVPHLVESILLPSKQVAEPFRTTVLTTTKGQTLSGLVVSETAEQIDLLLSDTTRKAVAKKDVEERALASVSPMPAGLVKSPRELQDLLAYLLTANPLPP